MSTTVHWPASSNHVSAATKQHSICVHDGLRLLPACLPACLPAVAYLTNAFVVPLLAAYFAGSSSSW